MGNFSVRSFSDYRWFKPSENGLSIHPYPLHINYGIDSAFLNHQNNFISRPYSIAFDYKQNQFKDGDTAIFREIVSSKALNIIRSMRRNRKSSRLILPNRFGPLDELKVFYFSSLFTKVELDIEDPFIVHFASHVAVLHMDLIDIFNKHLLIHLETFHHIYKEKFTFTKLRNILAKDFSNNAQLEPYSSYFIRKLEKHNFKEIIGNILIEEGDVFAQINQITTNKKINDNVLWFLLCLIYVYGTEANHSEMDKTYKQIEVLDIEHFKPRNVLMNYEFISTTKNVPEFDSSEKISKNIIEITYEPLFNKNWYMAFKAFDTEAFSQYPNEREVIIHPYCVFEVLSVKTLSEGVHYIKLLLKSNCFSDCIQYQMGILMQINLGICVNIGNDIFEMYPDIELERIASLTITDRTSLRNNLVNIGCMTNLRVFDLKNIDMTDDDVNELVPYMTNMLYLHYLNLSQNNISIEGIKSLSSVFVMMPYLEHINLNQNNLGDKGAIELANGLRSLNNLRGISLIYNQIKFLGIEALSKQLAHMPKLKILNLSTNFVYHEEMDNLVWALSQLKQLTNLNLSNNQISSEGLAMIGEKLHRNIQHLNFSENEITQEGIIDFSENLYKSPNLLSLILYGNKNGSNGIYALFSNLSNIPKLQILNLGCNFIGDNELLLITKQFPQMKQLQVLNLRENLITNEGMYFVIENLLELKLLQSLDLGWNSINGESFTNFPSIINQLEDFVSLNLDSNPISVTGLKTLMNELKNYDTNWNYIKGEFTRKPKNTKELFADSYIHQKKTKSKEILRFNTVNESSLTEEFNQIEYYEHVKQLIVVKGKLKITSISLLVNKMQFLTQLREIDMRCNDIGDEGIIELSKGFEYTPHLELIELRENNISDSGIKAFASKLYYLKELKSINLNWNLISDEGMNDLSKAPLSNLETLKLKDNSIGKDGMIAFSQSLKSFLHLTHLDLGWNKIGAEGMKAFSQNLIHLTDLSFLLLSKNEIGDNGMKEFAQTITLLPNLETLLLWNNQIGNDGAQSLLDKLEQCPKLKFLDLSINTINEDIKQKYHELGDTKKISIDI